MKSPPTIETSDGVDTVRLASAYGYTKKAKFTYCDCTWIPGALSRSEITLDNNNIGKVVQSIVLNSHPRMGDHFLPTRSRVPYTGRKVINCFPLQAGLQDRRWGFRVQPPTNESRPNTMFPFSAPRAQNPLPFPAANARQIYAQPFLSLVEPGVIR